MKLRRLMSQLSQIKLSYNAWKVNQRMNVYISMTLISMLFMYFSQKNQNHKRYRATIWLICSMIPFALVSGLRYYVGTDYASYLRPWSYIGSVFSGRDRVMEPLYRLMVIIGYKLNSTQVVFFETALIFAIFSFLFIKEY